MNNINDKEIRFNQECTVVNMDIEYPGNTSPIKWVIITEYTKSELESRYSNILDSYRPYEISPLETKEIFAEYRRNEDKYIKRQLRGISIYDIDDELNSGFAYVPSFEDDVCDRLDDVRNKKINAVKTALKALTEIQRKRFILHYLMGKSTREIASMDGIKEHKSVCESINAAKMKFINIINSYQFQ